MNTAAGLAGLRVGLVGPLPPPAGGMANQTRQLAELLRGQGAQVELVQTNAPYSPAWVAGVPVLRALFRLLPYAARLWAAAGRADVVHVMANSGWSWHLFAAPAIWLAHWRRTPVLVNYRGGEAASFLARSRAAVAFSLKRCQALVVPSGFLQQVFAAVGQRADVVPNIIDTQRFRPAAQPPAGDVRLLVARNLEPIYDNATAIRAFAVVKQRHPGARLTVAGTGPEEAALRALAQSLQLGDSLHFTGRLEREPMAELLRNSHVAINPSLVDNMPNSVLEALASGVPVVSTDVGGVPFIVRDGVSALLVPPADPAAMAAALLRLLEDPALGRSLAAAGLAEARRYTWDRIAPQWTHAYAQAMRSLPGRGVAA